MTSSHFVDPGLFALWFFIGLMGLVLTVLVFYIWYIVKSQRLYRKGSEFLFQMMEAQRKNK